MESLSGFDVNLKLNGGWNPLLLAASTGNASLVTELVSRGADVNVERGNVFYFMFLLCVSFKYHLVTSRNYIRYNI